MQKVVISAWDARRTFGKILDTVGFRGDTVVVKKTVNGLQPLCPARRDALVERKSQVGLTDAHIAEIIFEVHELRKMYEALHRIDNENTCHRRRGLLR